MQRRKKKITSLFSQRGRPNLWFWVTVVKSRSPKWHKPCVRMISTDPKMSINPSSMIERQLFQSSCELPWLKSTLKWCWSSWALERQCHSETETCGVWLVFDPTHYWLLQFTPHACHKTFVALWQTAFVIPFERLNLILSCSSWALLSDSVIEVWTAWLWLKHDFKRACIGT